MCVVGMVALGGGLSRPFFLALSSVQKGLTQLTRPIVCFPPTHLDGRESCVRQGLSKVLVHTSDCHFLWSLAA